MNNRSIFERLTKVTKNKTSENWLTGPLSTLSEEEEPKQRQQPTQQAPTPEPTPVQPTQVAQTPRGGSPETQNRAENFVAKVRSRIESKPTQKKRDRTNLERIDHPVAGKRIQDLAGSYSDEDKRVKENWDTLSTISDRDSAVRYLTEGLGYSMGEDGRLHNGTPNRERRSIGGAGMPGEGRGESRAINFEELKRFQDPEWQNVLENTYEDNGKGLQRLALKNNIPWDLATELYDLFDSENQGKLNGWGKPEAAQGTFTPMGPVEFLRDADGNFTGETNIDALARTNPEEYATHFSTENGGNRGRGVFLLQKLLANGGLDQYTGLPNFFDFDTVSPDHIQGRSSGAIEGGRFKDDPMNLILARRGLNQFKVSSNYGGERDTIKSMTEAAKKKAAEMGIDGEAVEDLFESEQFQNFMEYRMDQTEFDPKAIAKRSGDVGIDAYPESIEDLMELDDEVIKSLVGKNEKKNPLGLNMRNFSMLAPRPDERPLTTNTWGGAPGGGLEFNPLMGYRRAMLASALFDPEMQRQHREFEEELNAKRNRAGEPMADNKKQEALAKKRRDLIASNHFSPQKAAASLFGLGRINNQQFTDRLQALATGKLGFLKESNPELYGKMIGALEKEMTGYRGALDEKMPAGPHQFSDEDLMGNMTQPYIREVMTSNYGRSLMPRALVEAFDKEPGNSRFREPFTEGALDLTPKTVL